MSEQEDVHMWAERQAERYRGLLEWTREEPRRWAERKAALAATGFAFVYTYSDSEMWEYGKSSSAHRVVKKTATRVYVERRGFSLPDDPVQILTEGTFILDRAELEREGRAWSRAGHDAYYAVPYEDTPAWQEGLEARTRNIESMLTPESWLAHRRHVDEYLATGGVVVHSLREG